MDKKLAAKGETKTKTKPAKASKPGGKNAAKTLRVDCTVFAPGRFWLATALSYDEKTGKNPRLGLFSGSPSSRMMLFEIAPLPTEAIEKLIADNKEISVKIRKTRDDSSLVRLGVIGGPGGGKPDSSEVGMLLQLVAHQPPRILWVGPGDQVASADGCVVEQTVDFELLFRTRLERFTTSKPRAGADGKIPATCKSDPGTQESLTFQPVALGRGRAVGEPPAATP